MQAPFQNNISLFFLFYLFCFTLRLRNSFAGNYPASGVSFEGDSESSVD